MLCFISVLFIGPAFYFHDHLREMIEIYESKGVSHADAVLVINTLAKYKDFFVDVMMTQELELQVPEKDHVKQSFKEGEANTHCLEKHEVVTLAIALATHIVLVHS
jgi:hypothetical protein